MLTRKCDICGREIRKTEGRYKLVFIGRLYDTDKDVCADCIKRIAEEIKQADTPQTDCETCRHYKLACELFSEVCKYEPTIQTETQNSNLPFEKCEYCEYRYARYVGVCDMCELIGDEPNSSEKPNNCKKCKWWNESYGCHWKEGVCHYVPKAIIPKQCVSCDSASRIIEAYSQGFKDGADAVKAMPQTFTADGIVFAKMDEPQTERSE